MNKVMTFDAGGSRAAPVPHPGMGFGEFVALIAALMATNALAIDSMLPALPAIGHDLGVVGGNARQWIVTAYLLGFGAAQIVYGPLADRFGRKRPILVGLAIYVAASLAAAWAGSLGWLILARVVQGVGAAATRVLAASIVRDCYSGRPMARVMSLAFIVFLAVPVFAPSIGQLIMRVAPWQGIFYALAGGALAVAVWTAVRLPETLHAEDRMPMVPARVMGAFWLCLRNRIALGYMLASTLILGALFGFINSAQQVFETVFGAKDLFAAIFAFVALFIALSSLLNAKVVVRLGTRAVSHAALLGFVAIAVVHAGVALSGAETLWSFALLQAAMMFCFGLVVSNFGALGMGPLGHVAGTASSVQGFVTILGGAILGFVIGQQFDGTVAPLTLGFATCGLLALGVVLWTERGRLFGSLPNAARAPTPPAR